MPDPDDPHYGPWSRRLGEILDATDATESPLVVVGHSLGGLTIPLVPALRPVKLLVFLCGFLPQPGTSMKEQVRDQHVFAPAYAALARRQTRLPDGSSRWPPDAAIEAFYPDCPPQLASWAASKLGRQVWTIFDETTPLEAWPPVGAVSILCREDRVVSPDWSRRVSTERLGRPAVELDGGHSPFLSRPAELADLLVALSA
jgi:pimeloyl-ACP methyl ester carboxylesterase